MVVVGKRAVNVHEMQLVWPAIKEQNIIIINFKVRIERVFNQ